MRNIKMVVVGLVLMMIGLSMTVEGIKELQQEQSNKLKQAMMTKGYYDLRSSVKHYDTSKAI